MQLTEITNALDALRQRGIGIVMDDSSNPPKSVLFAPGRDLSYDCLNEILSISASQVFVTINEQRKRAFQLGPMQRSAGIGDQQRSSLPLCESVEAREGIHTGISVFDRNASIRILAAEEPNPKRIVKPGHIFPLEVVEGGVLVKPAVFEAAADITFLLSGYEVAAVVDLLGSSGDYLDTDEVRELSKKLNLPLFSLSSLVVYRLRTEQLIEKVAEAKLPVLSGLTFQVSSYRSKINGSEHIALSLGGNFDAGPVLTRVHRERLLSDIFEPLSGEHASTLGKSISAIEKEGRGLIIYLRNAQQSSFLNLGGAPGRDTLFREYGVGAQIIKQCGVKQLELLSSSSAIPDGLENFGLEITGIRQI